MIAYVLNIAKLSEYSQPRHVLHDHSVYDTLHLFRGKALRVTHCKLAVDGIVAALAKGTNQEKIGWDNYQS